MAKVTPVIIAGGSGTRLWPSSRRSYPKQFAKLVGNKSLYQECSNRLVSSNILKFDKQIIVTQSDYRFIVGEQLESIGIDPGIILIEPESKNTAPAILAATLYSNQNDPNSILLVAPADHVIKDRIEFHKMVAKGLVEVQKGNIVTFGIKPTYPDTGYGYLELDKSKADNAVKVKSFVEKPGLVEAKNMLENDNYLWNAGIFMFRSKDMISAFKMFCPELLDPVKNSIDNGSTDLDFFRLFPEAWRSCKNVSIDYAVMELANNLVAIPFVGAWSDLGNWNSVWNELGPNEHGVVTSGNAHSIDCKDVLLRSENDNLTVVGLGLKDTVVVAMPDAVLVSHKDQVQNVKTVVNELNNAKVSQANSSQKDHRPWGWFETLALGGRFQVKRILVKPGAALSLQNHHHRSEHWIVVEGTAKVTINEKVSLLSEGQSVYIELGAIHRMENPGKVPMVLIEVQTGAYLGEDDIIRYDDIYSRC